MNQVFYYNPQFKKLIDQLLPKGLNSSCKISVSKDEFDICVFILSKNIQAFHKTIQNDLNVILRTQSIENQEGYIAALKKLTKTNKFWIEDIDTMDDIILYFAKTRSTGINTLQFLGMAYYLLSSTDSAGSMHSP